MTIDEYAVMHKCRYLLLLILLALGACSAQAPPSSASNHEAAKVVVPSGSPQRASSFSRIEIAYPHDHCSYEFSPVDFCDEHHVAAYNIAIEREPINFHGRYILLSIPERKEYHQSTLVVIDPGSGIVYPLPFDAYSGVLDPQGNASSDGTLEFSTVGNTVCIRGSLLVYRAFESGLFCFSFESGRFGGHATEYTRE